MPLINVRQRKRELRARYKKLRAECDPALKKKLDEQLCERFCSLEEFAACETLFAFISTGIECDTEPIIREAFARGKRVAVPKCRADENEMDFYFIHSYEDLAPGKYGILEPDPDKCETATDWKSGLCLVPGLCFDYDRYRLGFGKGYYDRFISGFGGVTAGVCYSRCIVSELPRGNYDKAVDILVTERFINRA